MNVIEINGLVKKYPGFTLGPLNLEVPQGAAEGAVMGVGVDNLIEVVK